MPVNASGKNTSSTFLTPRKLLSVTGWPFWSLSVKSGASVPASSTQRLPAALDFGCTSRLAIQSPRLADDVCIRPAVGADSAISAGCTWPGLPVLGVTHPDHAVVGQRRDGVHQAVDEVAVAVAPPQQHHVDDLVGVLVEQLAAARLFDVGPDVVVDVLVPAQLLHNLIFLDAQSAGVVRGVIRRDHGRSSFSQLGARALAMFEPYRRTPGRERRRTGGQVHRYAASHRFSAVVLMSFSLVIAALNSSGP